MGNKTDWAKIIAIVLAVLFLLMWILGIGYSVEGICETQLKDLHYKWQQTHNTVLNCYENDLSTCNYLVPTLGDN